MTTTPAAPAARPGAVARLRAPGARRWYFGASFGLLYQAIEVTTVWTAGSGSVGMRALATVLLFVVYALYLVLPPLLWPERTRVRIAAVVGYWALTCVLFPVIGPYTIWTWTLIVVVVGFTWIPRIGSLLMLLAVVGAQLLVGWSVDWINGLLYTPTSRSRWAW
ncbi:hypothetical protein [Pseudolysinimonas kribbensis]|nr:hypothetical protein [Pseudolysinimonas kribbensis]